MKAWLVYLAARRSGLIPLGCTWSAAVVVIVAALCSSSPMVKGLCAMALLVLVGVTGCLCCRR